MKIITLDCLPNDYWAIVQAEVIENILADSLFCRIAREQDRMITGNIEHYFPEPFHVRLIIQQKPPTQNDFATRYDGRGRWAYKNIKRKWLKYIRPPSEVGEKATGLRGIWAGRVLGPRERAFDLANFIGGLKPVLDVLVSQGWLLDDRPSACRFLGADQMKAPWEGIGGPALVLDLTDIPQS